MTLHSAASERPSTRPQRRHRGRRTSTLTTNVVLGLLAVLTLLPLIYALFGSFKSSTELLQSGARLLPRTWDLSGYRDTFALGDFGRYLFNSVVVAVGVIALDAVASSMLGYVMARRAAPGVRVYQALLSASLFIGVGTATLYPRYLIASSLGLDNQVGIILVEVASISVIHSFLVMSFVSSLPQEIEEAARIDGCGLFGCYRRVVLPLVTPILATTTVLAFQHGWNNFEVPFVFTLARPELRTLVVGVYQLRADSGSVLPPYSMMLAGAMIVLVPVLVLFLCLQRYFIRGMAEGAVKG